MIKDDVKELTQINSEIKRLSTTLKGLRSTKKIIEERMAKFLTDRDFDGGKVGNNIILLRERSVKRVKPKKDLDKDLVHLFLRHNIGNPEAFMKEFNETAKDTVVHSVIKIKKQKEK